MAGGGISGQPEKPLDTPLSKDAYRLYELLDLLTEVASLMEYIRYTHILSYYNTYFIWCSSDHKQAPSLPPQQMDVESRTVPELVSSCVPPFLESLQSIRETVKTMNNPCFNYDTPSAPVGNARKILVSTK